MSATDFDWCHVELIEYERHIPLAFKSLFKTVGVPNKMVMDAARAQVHGDVPKICNMVGCTIVELAKDTPASNRAERTIGELKVRTKEDITTTHSPVVFWCYCIKRRAKIHVVCARENFQLDGTTPHSFLTGNITDISNLCWFGWFEWVKFRKEGASAAYPLPHEHLGRCLGPADNKGNVMAQNVLTIDGEILPIQTLRSLTPSEYESEKPIMERFTQKIRDRYGDHLGPPKSWVIRRAKPEDDDQHEDPLWQGEDNPQHIVMPQTNFHSKLLTALLMNYQRLMMSLTWTD